MGIVAVCLAALACWGGQHGQYVSTRDWRKRGLAAIGRAADADRAGRHVIYRLGFGDYFDDYDS